MRELWLPGRPVPASRPRGTRGQRAYYTEPYKSWLEVATSEAAKRWAWPTMTGAVRASIRVTPAGVRIQVVESPVKAKEFRHGLRGDLDNYIKGVLDALSGSVYGKDSQVVTLDARFMGGDDG